jgi:hypothetical protein
MLHLEGALLPVLSFLFLFPVAGLPSDPPPPETASPHPEGMGGKNHPHKRRNPGGREYRAMMRIEGLLFPYFFRTHPLDFHMMIPSKYILHPHGGTFSFYSLPEAAVLYPE